MRNQKNEDKKKQAQLPSSGNKPQVLNPKVLSPHDIEREILLKKIESLQYTIRAQETENSNLKENLYWAGKCVHRLEADKDFFQKQYSESLTIILQMAKHEAWQAKYINELLFGSSPHTPESEFTVIPGLITKN